MRCLSKKFYKQKERKVVDLKQSLIKLISDKYLKIYQKAINHSKKILKNEQKTSEKRQKRVLKKFFFVIKITGNEEVS